MKRLFVKTSIGAVGLVTLLLVPLQGCTDLSERPISSFTPGNFSNTEGEVTAALAGVYAGLRNTAGEGEYWGVSEVSTDEMVVPTRGSDWFDNGTWLELHRQTWSANSPSTLSFLNNARNTAYAGIARANVLVTALEGMTVGGGLGACQAAINRVDSIIASGVYQLADTFTQNFSSDNGSSPENIFVIKYADADGLGFNMVMRTLHYNQFNPSPWNGFATLAQTYNAFDPADKRRNMFLVGPQVNLETGLPAQDRAHNPLVFTTTIANVTSATEGEGARIYKWPIDPKHVAQNNGNDFAWFRLAEMYLIKAEALNEITPGSAGALDTLNRVRARTAPVAAALAGPITRDLILNERLFELNSEGKRRQDLIRHGKYTLAWEFKTGPTGDFRVLMPIPQTQIDANPLITQNPGY